MDDMKRLVDLADYNMRQGRIAQSFQTSIDDWSERTELEAMLMEAVLEIDIPSEPRQWSDVVSFGPGAVLGFLYKPDERRMVFS